MIIAIVIISIFAIFGITMLANKILPFRVCPICAGVAGTWLWMFGGMFIGVLPASNFQLPTAILMGGSIAGIAYQIAKLLPPRKSEVLFKTLFIPAGFAVVYGLLLVQYLLFTAATAFLVVVAVAFLRPDGKKSDKENEKIKNLEERLKDCC